MTTLEDLYYGNISPCKRDIRRGSRIDKPVKLICKNDAVGVIKCRALYLLKK